MKPSDARKMEKKLNAMKKALDAAFALMGDEENDDGTAEDIRCSLHNINSAIDMIEQSISQECPA